MMELGKQVYDRKRGRVHDNMVEFTTYRKADFQKGPGMSVPSGFLAPGGCSLKTDEERRPWNWGNNNMTGREEEYTAMWSNSPHTAKLIFRKVQVCQCRQVF